MKEARSHGYIEILQVVSQKPKVFIASKLVWRSLPISLTSLTEEKN